jgi:hypothetical protein
MKTIALIACFGLGLTSLPLKADSWMLPPEVKETNYVFGSTEIILHYDSMGEPLYPKYTLTIKNKGKTASTHPDIGFQQLFASPDNAYFLGVSNSGLMEDAYVIFNAKGKIIKRQRHDPSKVSYQTMSISLVRRWYDAGNPGVKFAITNGMLRDVTIRAGDGKVVSLLAPAPTQPPPGSAPVAPPALEPRERLSSPKTNSPAPLQR